jgi:pimeloyl-ACP methyl ester carboxylesterase
MEDVVILVPGFLGFSRLGGFYYFAERLITALRGSLEQPEGGALPVVPVTTLPTNSLRDRQQALLAELQALSARLGEVRSFHLIGHSTGGVDAQLLACMLDSEGNRWLPQWDTIRSKIRSVITISAPHFGTELADSRLALLAKSPLKNPRAIVDEARILGGLGRLIPRYLAATAGFNVVAPNDVLRFAWQVIQNRDLVDDLTPRRMEGRRATLAHNPEVRLVCFVTGAHPRTDSARSSDPLYTDIYDLTAGHGKATPAVQRRQRFLAAEVANNPMIVIKNKRVTTVLPAISLELNDGVVNSVRQIVHDEPSELGGFVVADHADSMGHYDRQDALIDGRPYNAGLFHSGAGFGDPQFFQLYWRAAEVVLGSRDRTRANGRQNGGDDDPPPLSAPSRAPAAGLRARAVRPGSTVDFMRARLRGPEGAAAKRNKQARSIADAPAAGTSRSRKLAPAKRGQVARKRGPQPEKKRAATREKRSAAPRAHKTRGPGGR